MREIGGYIEIDKFQGTMLYDDLIKLNCGRSCLAYLIEARKITKIALPKYCCSSVRELCERYNLNIHMYSVDKNMLPIIDWTDEDRYLYVVNFFGQLSVEQVNTLKKKNDKMILDNAQAYFMPPIKGIDTIYTSRKFFGVADGAILATDAMLERIIPLDISYNRMNFLLGRYEGNASDFYKEYSDNNEYFDTEPIKHMSKLTENILHGINYSSIKKNRTCNYLYLEEKLGKINELKPKMIEGAFAYPLLIQNAQKVRKILADRKIYIPLLWPNVLEENTRDSFEYRFSYGILPLPVDQRYNESDMEYMATEIIKIVNQ